MVASINWLLGVRMMVERSTYYCRTVAAIASALGLREYEVVMLGESLGYNVFTYDGVEYMGSKEQRADYYNDKLLGQNPFYQTS